MNTRREEEVITADGPRERGGRDGRVFGSGAGRNRADEGTQLVRIRGFARVVSQLKRAVFVGEGRKNGLLPHEVQSCRRSLQVVPKQSLKGPCSVRAFVPGSRSTSIGWAVVCCLVPLLQLLYAATAPARSSKLLRSPRRKVAIHFLRLLFQFTKNSFLGSLACDLQC
jgi:hypothetical protein